MEELLDWLIESNILKNITTYLNKKKTLTEMWGFLIISQNKIQHQYYFQLIIQNLEPTYSSVCLVPT